MIKITSNSDCNKIKDLDHRVVIKTFFDEIMKEIYKDSPPEDIGWIVYCEKGDDLFGEKGDNPDGLIFNESHGIWHCHWGQSPGWEAVELYGGMWMITVITSNSFGVTYFLPNNVIPSPQGDLLGKFLSIHCKGQFILPSLAPKEEIETSIKVPTIKKKTGISAADIKIKTR